MLTSTNNPLSFLIDSGEMGQIIKDYNWKETPIESIEKWPISLRSILGIILHSEFPMFLFWGSDLICFYNDKFRPSLGDDGKHPAIGKKGQEVWPEIWEFIGPLIHQIMTTGKAVWFEDQLVPFYRNGSIENIYWTFSYSPAYNDEGAINGVFVTCTETTDRVLAEQKQKKTEEALREREEHLRALITATSDIIYTMNADWSEMGVLQGKVVVPNTGMPIRNWFEKNIPHSDQHAVRDAINKAIQHKSVFQLEHRIRLANGNIGWTFSRAIPILDSHGNIIEWLGAASDVSERKLVEEALKESEERFRAIADDAPVFLFLAGENAAVEYLNKTWRDYTGVASEDSKGRAWAEITHPEDIDPATKIYMDGFNNRRSCTFENRQKGADGIFRTILWKATPRFSPNGQFIGMMGVGLDIHDRKLLEDELKNRNQELQKINNDLDNFIYTASHDLKAPIANLEGLLIALKKIIGNKIGEREKQLLKLIDLSIARFVSTIKDLTEISKLQIKEGDDLQQVFFQEVLEGIILDINPLLIEKNASITTDFQVDHFEFSRKDLNSILYNLVSNAIKYSSPDRLPIIQVRTKFELGKLVLSVQDNGLGIDLKNKEKIFTMFKRLHTHVDGTGIGLYIVKKLTENYGGYIEVESELGKGSIFSLHFKMR